MQTVHNKKTKRNTGNEERAMFTSLNSRKQNERNKCYLARYLLNTPRALRFNTYEYKGCMIEACKKVKIQVLHLFSKNSEERSFRDFIIAKLEQQKKISLKL